MQSNNIALIYVNPDKNNLSNLGIANSTRLLSPHVVPHGSITLTCVYIWCLECQFTHSLTLDQIFGPALTLTALFPLRVFP
jgi:hypothetical protein